METHTFRFRQIHNNSNKILVILFKDILHEFAINQTWESRYVYFHHATEYHPALLVILTKVSE